MIKPNFSVSWSASKDSNQAWFEVVLDEVVGEKVMVLKFLSDSLDLFIMCEVLLVVV